MTNLLPTCPAGSAPDDEARALWEDERRRRQRFSCSLRARVMFVRQGKPCPVRVGEWFDVRVVDIGQGGVQVVTPWPLSLNDALVTEMQPAEGRILRWRMRVVRVRQQGPQEWRAGLQFVEEA